MYSAGVWSQSIKGSGFNLVLNMCFVIQLGPEWRSEMNSGSRFDPHFISRVSGSSSRIQACMIIVSWGIQKRRAEAGL